MSTSTIHTSGATPSDARARVRAGTRRRALPRPSAGMPPTGARRHGAALLEGTIVLGVFVTIVLGLFDLGLAVMRQNTLAEAARRLAREAIVHGELAAPDRSVWGPGRVTGTAEDGSEQADVVEPALVNLDPSGVAYELTWPDGDNRSGDRVVVALSYSHSAILPRLFGHRSLVLRCESAMRIEH